MNVILTITKKYFQQISSFLRSTSERPQFTKCLKRVRNSRTRIWRSHFSSRYSAIFLVMQHLLHPNLKEVQHVPFLQHVSFIRHADAVLARINTFYYHYLSQRILIPTIKQKIQLSLKHLYFKKQFQFLQRSSPLSQKFDNLIYWNLKACNKGFETSISLNLHFKTSKFKQVHEGSSQQRITKNHDQRKDSHLRKIK